MSEYFSVYLKKWSIYFKIPTHIVFKAIPILILHSRSLYHVARFLTQLDKFEADGAFPLAYWNRPAPKSYHEERPITAWFQLVAVLHCRRLSLIKMLWGSDVGERCKTEEMLL